MDTGCPFRDITGIILAGGKSHRYGKNKALAHIGGIPLIERVVRVIQPLFQDIIIVTNTPKEYAYLRLPMYKDLIKGLGPLGGIYTALTNIPGDSGFVVACDMPYLNRELIQYMIKTKGNFDVIVPRISGKTEALHSLYGKSCLPAIRKSIDCKKYQVVRFFPDVSVRYIDEDEIRHFDRDLRSFLNVNSPQDLKNNGPIA